MPADDSEDFVTTSGEGGTQFGVRRSKRAFLGKGGGHRVAILGGSSSGKTVYLGMLFHLFQTGRLGKSWRADWDDDAHGGTATRAFLRGIRAQLRGVRTPGERPQRRFPEPTTNETELSFTLRRPWGLGREVKLRVRSGDVPGEFTRRMAEENEGEASRAFAKAVKSSRAVLYFISGFPERMPDPEQVDTVVCELLKRDSRVRYFAFVLAAADIFELTNEEDPKTFVERVYAGPLGRIAAQEGVGYGVFPVFSIGRGRVFQQPPEDNAGACAQPGHRICPNCQRLDDDPAELEPEGLMEPWDAIFRHLRGPWDNTPAKATLFGLLRPILWLAPVALLAGLALVFAYLPWQRTLESARELSAVAESGYPGLEDHPEEFDRLLALRKALKQSEENPLFAFLPNQEVTAALAATEDLAAFGESRVALAPEADEAAAAEAASELVERFPESPLPQSLKLVDRAAKQVADALVAPDSTFEARLLALEKLANLAPSVSGLSEPVREELARAYRGFGVAAGDWLADTQAQAEAWSADPGFAEGPDDLRAVSARRQTLTRLQRAVQRVATGAPGLGAGFASASQGRTAGDLDILQRFAQGYGRLLNAADGPVVERFEHLQQLMDALPPGQEVADRLRQNLAWRLGELQQRGLLLPTRVAATDAPWRHYFEALDLADTALATPGTSAALARQLREDRDTTLEALGRKVAETKGSYDRQASRAQGLLEEAGPANAAYWQARAAEAAEVAEALDGLTANAPSSALRGELEQLRRAAGEAAEKAALRARFEELVATLRSFSPNTPAAALDEWESAFEPVVDDLLPDVPAWKRFAGLNVAGASALAPRVTDARQRLAEARASGSRVRALAETEQRLTSGVALPLSVLVTDLNQIERLLLSRPERDLGERAAKAAAGLLRQFRDRNQGELGVAFLETVSRASLTPAAASSLLSAVETWQNEPGAYGLTNYQLRRLAAVAQGLRSSASGGASPAARSR